jgi:hypothetical protein
MSEKIIRLSEFEIDAIKSSFKKIFQSDTDHIWIFGSRIDAKAKGGDIDLYIETKEDDLSVILDLKIKFLSDLEWRIGEQKIDVVINRSKSKTFLSIYQEGKKGVCLL